jgi:hypothetical protein
MSEVLFEYMRSGTSIKVTAIEPNTGVEAVVVVPAGLSEQQMQARAMQKLLYILKKKEEE